MAGDGATPASIDADRFLVEAIQRCQEQNVIVRNLGKMFCLPFYDGPDGTRCHYAASLAPGAEVFIKEVVLSADGMGASGRTDYSNQHGAEMWVNVRSRLNKSGRLLQISQIRILDRQFS